MPVLNASQVAVYASNAGFRGSGLIMAIAIAGAESGFNSDAIGPVGEVGLWQVYIPAHPQYSKSFLLTPQGSAAAAYQISNGGTNWRPWCTSWSDGSCGTRGGTYQGSSSPYQRYMQQATAAASGSFPNSPSANISAPKIPLWCQPFMAQSVAWWETNSHHYPKDWGAAEGGVDWNPVPLNAPITALLPGVVVGSGYFCKPLYYCGTTYQGCTGAQGYGVVTIRSSNPYPQLVQGNLIDIYYQHIIIDPSIGLTCAGSSGQQVQSGQIIGKGNGSYNIEVGINVGTEWGRIWGGTSPGPHVDPIPFLHTLIGSGAVGGSPVGNPLGGAILGTIPIYMPLGNQVHKTLIDTPGFYGIALAVDEAEQFPGWIDLTTQTKLSTPNITVPGSVPGIGGQSLLPGATVSVPDISGVARSVGATISDNFVPFAIRGGLVLMGSVLFMLLMGKAIEEPVKSLLPLFGVEA